MNINPSSTVHNAVKEGFYYKFVTSDFMMILQSEVEIGICGRAMFMNIQTFDFFFFRYS